MSEYFFNIGKMWSKIFNKREVPRYVEKAFESSKIYVDDCNPEYRGMLLLFDHKKHLEGIFRNGDITRITGKNMNQKRNVIDDFVKKYGQRVLDSHTMEFFDLIGHCGETVEGMEGAVAINLSGNYVDSGLFIEGVRSKGIQILADTGARHRAGAFVSKDIVDYSVVVSEETGRVTVFKEGKTHKGMSYIPKTKPPEEELYSDDLTKEE